MTSLLITHIGWRKDEINVMFNLGYVQKMSIDIDAASDGYPGGQGHSAALFIEDDSELDKARSAAAELGPLGGVARARNLSTEQKAEIGRKGAAEPGRNRNVSLQNRYRPAATRRL